MRKKKSTQQLVGIESVTDSSVLTAGGELTFYLVQPTNLNVLPESHEGDSTAECAEDLGRDGAAGVRL